jgi:uncharacterized membrane protein
MFLHNRNLWRVIVTPHYFYWRFLFWPQLAGIVFLVLGLIVIRRLLSLRIEVLPVLGRVFVPFALAVFGTEHMVSANFMKEMVPDYVPGHVFWIYFVGLALYAAAISIMLDRQVDLSGPLLGLMWFLFVLMLHMPRVVANPRDRFAWAVVLRDFVFALGAWTFAAIHIEPDRPVLARRVIAVCRVLAALIFLFFGVEHLLHPGYTPGVPLPQLTAAWIPWKHVWGFCIGVLLLASGITMLINHGSRMVTTWLGIGVTVVVLFINLPMLLVAREPSAINTGMNYVGDTLLFAGIIFFFATAMPRESTTGTVAAVDSTPTTNHTVSHVH